MAGKCLTSPPISILIFVVVLWVAGGFVDSFASWIESNRGLLAIGLLLWVVLLVTPVTWFLFFHLAKDVTPAVASAYVALIGLPASPGLIGFVKHRLDKRKDAGL